MLNLLKSLRLLVVLALATVVLGTAGGLLNLPGRVGAGGFLDVVLQAASYLTLNGFEPLASGAGNGLIRVARVLALLFVGLGVAILADAVIKELANRHFWWRARGWFGPDAMDLICGLDWHGRAFVCSACGADTQNAKTLAIDAHPSDGIAAECRRNGVPLLVADPCSSDVLDRLDLRRIARVFVTTGSDDANMRIVFRLAEQYRKAGDGRDGGRKLLCMVHLSAVAEHGRLLRALPPRHGLDIRVFNEHAVTVRELHRRYPLDRFPPRMDAGAVTEDVLGAHLVLLGGGAMAEELLLQALQLNHYEPSKSLKVDVLHGRGSDAAARWRSRHPCHVHGSDLDSGGVELVPEAAWIAANVLPAIRFHDDPGSGRGQIEWCETHCDPRRWATTVVVALDDPDAAATVAITLAETLRSLHPGGDIELWVYVNDRGSDRVGDIVRLFEVAGLDRRRDGAEWVRVFNDYFGQCRRDLINALEIEGAAKRVNQVYGLKWRGEGVSEAAFLADDADIDRRWFELYEDDRDSNRQAASHAWVKRRILARIRPDREVARLEAGHDLRQRALADPSWLLATIEHRRWCAQQLLRGMRPLLALPVAMDPRQWHEDDRRKADDWFGSREAKQAWRLRGYHIDLMSFESLACFDALEGRAGQGGIEQENDLTISRMTDYIIDGRVPAP